MITVKESILAHAKKETPNECCGVVVIFKGKEKYVACENIHIEPEEFFRISPKDYAMAEDIGEIIKIVHSHPKTNPAPTPADLVMIENKEINLPWIIVNPITEQFTETKPSGYKADLIGRKFSHGILDCYSIIKDYYDYELGIKIPDFYRENKWWERGENLYLENFEKAGFHKVDNLQEHDVIIMTMGSTTPNHSAIYLGDNRILHHVQFRLSSRDMYGGYWQKNTWGIVRHENFL